MVVDSNIIIDFMRSADKGKTILGKLVGTTPLFVSTVTVYEIYAGAQTPQKWSEAQLVFQPFTILSFDEATAQVAGKIYQDLKKKGQLIEMADLMIASTALAHNLPLKTLNIKHFSRVTGLLLV